MRLLFIFIILISFHYNSFSQCTINNATDCECENPNDVDCDLLPDITVSWQHGINDYTEYPPGEGLQNGEINYPENWFQITPEVEAMGRIRVGARTPNIGVGPLNLRGANQDGYRWMICYDSGDADTFQVYDPNWNEESYCPDGSSPKHISWQRIYHKNADGSMTYYEEMVGTMEYHPTHGHMHFDEWTIMTLRIPDPNNMDNPTEWEIVGEGAKVGFCVMDLGNCSSENAGCRDDESTYNEGNLLSQDDFPNYGLGGGQYGCSPISQGISSGYNDTYGSYLDGMFINIPLGTCNGDYAIVLEVPQVMVESNLDNNYTWFPITLTQQSEGSPQTTVSSSADGIICEGESVEINVTTTPNANVEWSNGMMGNNIEVTELGSYTVTVSDDQYDCPYIETITLLGIDNPEIVDTIFLCYNESANINVSSDNDITWYDSDNNVVAQGESFQTPILTDNVTYYVSSSISSYNTAPLTHEGDNEYSGGQNSNGYVLFDAMDDFTLSSVEVYTNEPGERVIMLWDEDGNVVASHTEDVGFSDNEPHTINLNFNVPAGNGYVLGTDTASNQANFGGGNPYLKRTDGTGLSYPYVLDNLVSINNSPYGTDWYYYFYNWKISIQPIECELIPVEINVEGSTSTSQITTCDQYIWNQEIYTESGIYSHNTESELDCDILDVLVLTINNSTYSTEEITSCDEFVWNGNYYTESGLYIYESLNEFGCLKSDTLALNINNSTESNLEITNCDEYLWNGNLYLESGTYNFQSINQDGCIELETLELTINSSSESIENITTCDNYFWNGVLYSESGTYLYESTNVYGCYNLETLNLTISNNGDSELIEVVECDSFNWNGENYTQSGVYDHLYTGADGCESSSTLTLTINNSTSFIENIVSCNSYEWNGQVLTNNGTYINESLNEYGCTHISSLNLSIIDSNSTNLYVNTCNESYSWNNNIYDESGIYINELTNVNGCDSTIFLNLTVFDIINENDIIGNPNPIVFETNTYSVLDNGNNFEWYVDGGVIISDNGNSVVVQWGVIGEGFISVTESNEGCVFENSLTVFIENNVEESWNCFNNECVNPLDGTGIFNSIQECEQNCHNNVSTKEFEIFYLNIYPNPSDGLINIELDLLKTINLEISILNYLGEIVFVDEITHQNGQYKRTIDLRKFAGGIYLLNIHNENHNINQKIIIQ